MPSKSSLIADDVSALVRMARVECCESSEIELRPLLTAECSRCHDGCHASSGLSDMKVAKPSLSQMSFHHFIVTRSPNHMCAISWAIVSATAVLRSKEAVESSTS